ncbi:MAG: PIG-L family deacetylase [Chitinophagaceae bacterium]
MMQRFQFPWFLILAFIASYVTAQTPQALSSSDILLGLKKLNVLGSVLYVAAHPDDENTRLMAYFVKDKLYRTGYLSLTRGDGGQNLIGNEQGIELGMIRTQELLAARRIDGAEQYFTRAYDFGFSKSTEEALRIWDKNKILSDVVWIIRRFRPDVIITRFPQDNRAGHGHHSASAVLAVEAFSAAADPARFPEQLKYVKAWQTERIVWNTFNFGGTNTQAEDQLKIDVGTFNPLIGKGYGEIAAESRSQHKSQGFGIARQRGEALEYFSPWKGELPKNHLFDAVNTNWDRVKGGELIQGKIEQLINEYALFEPGKSVKGLVELYRSLQGLEEGYWKEQKIKEVKQLIEACSGLWIEATANQPYVVQADSLRINFFMNNRNGNAVLIKKIMLEGFDSSLNRSLELNRNLIITKPVYIPASKPVTQPYWLEQEMKQGSFEVKDQLLIGNADTKPALEVLFTLNVEGEDLVLTKPVRYKYTDPVKGEIYEPVYVYPRIVVYPALKTVFLDKNNMAMVGMQLRSYTDTVDARLSLSLPAGLANGNNSNMHYEWKAGNAFNKANQVSFNVRQKSGSVLKEVVGLNAVMNESVYSRDLKEIKHDHIPPIVYFPEAKANVVKLDLQIVGKKLGYIEGAGDYVPTALRQMGYEVTMLGDNDLSNADLSQFDAILTGVRAYNVKESLNTYHEKLMDYVKQGGNLIVQYNTSSQLGPVKAKIGPYAFNITRTRVSDENAKVKVLKPDHPVMNYPNKITAEDFDNWVQERSIYHAQNWDSHYETIFSMNDPGEKQDEGSLIMTKYGNGIFVYTGLVFFRELPAGVTGSYRLLANMIALNKGKNASASKKL